MQIRYKARREKAINTAPSPNLNQARKETHSYNSYHISPTASSIESHSFNTSISTTMKLLHLTLAGLSAISVNALPARSNAIRSGDADLIARQLSDTSNDLTDGSACQAITVIFARGTTETGNIGAVVGPALKSALGTGTAFQGVTYPADVAGFLQGGDSTGSATMASLVSQASTQCPDTKIVLSGYRYGVQRKRMLWRCAC